MKIDGFRLILTSKEEQELFKKIDNLIVKICTSCIPHIWKFADDDLFNGELRLAVENDIDQLLNANQSQNSLYFSNLDMLLSNLYDGSKKEDDDSIHWMEFSKYYTYKQLIEKYRLDLQDDLYKNIISQIKDDERIIEFNLNDNSDLSYDELLEEIIEDKLERDIFKTYLMKVPVTYFIDLIKSNIQS